MRLPAGPIEIRGLETTPKSTAAPACARMSPCGQRAAARLVACESCWQHCRGGEAAHGSSCVRVRRRAPGDVRALLGCVVGTCEPPACLAWRKPSTHRLLCNVSMTPRRQHKHTTDRVCACAPGKEQTALVVRARLGIIAVESSGASDAGSAAGHGGHAAPRTSTPGASLPAELPIGGSGHAK